MARMPGAKWLGEHSPRTPMSRYDVFCIHTIVGYAPAHAAHFSTHADGQIDQSRDTRFRSAANLDGNHRVIASENEDHGPAFGGVPRLPAWVPLTDAQVIANGKILAWLNDAHGIPLQLCPDSRPGSRGLGYHRQGIDGNFGGYRFGGRVTGGEVWTSSYGKVCPTDVRIAQLPDILDVALTLNRGGSIASSQGDDMPSPDDMWNHVLNPRADKKDQMQADEALRIAANSALRVEARQRQMLREGRQQANRLARAIDALPDGATKAEVKQLLEQLDATIKLVVNEG